MNIDCLENVEKAENERCVLLFGGRGYERAVSLAGAYRFLKEVEKTSLHFLPIFINQSGDFYIFDGNFEDIAKINEDKCRDMLEQVYPIKIGSKSGFLKNGVLIPVRLVFPLLHGDFGEDGTIQGLLSSLGMKFAGADNFAGAVSADKIFSKIIASTVGVPTLPHIVLSCKTYDAEKLAERIEKDFGFPVFVKPARLGSSVGASLVKTGELLGKSLDAAFSVAQRIMIEPAVIEKRELECAYFCAGEIRIITHPAEISCESGFYDYDSKYNGIHGVTLRARADISKDVCERIRAYTDILADALTVKNIARFDYFLLPDGRVFFNEVNTMPGMTETSLYPAMLELAGLKLSEFIKALGEEEL